jgi:diguanylate cyclase (GGDEF)-like protein
MVPFPSLPLGWRPRLWAWLTDTRVRGSGREKIRAGSVHFGGGALCAILVLAAGGQVNTVAILAIVVVTMLAILTCIIWVRKFRDGVYHGLCTLGSLVVGIAMLSANGEYTTFSATAFFVFVIDFAALFFSSAMLMFQVLFALATETTVLVLVHRPGAIPVQLVMSSILLIGTGGLVRYLVGLLRRSAAMDALTGLPNRRALGTQARKEAAHAGPGRHLGLLLLDLDRFKEVNDTLGHAAGDEVLIEIASRLSAVVGPRQMAARLGGDEFVLMLPDLHTPEEAEATAHHLLESLRNAPLSIDGVSLDLDFSIGVAVGPDDGREFGTLLKHADVAMYLAKADRGRVARYAAEDDDNNRARLSLVPELRSALQDSEAGGLSIAYQPKASLPSEIVQGVEALLRWNHPTRGQISPDVFIPIAERTGLIWGLTAWVLDSVCEQIARWWSQGHQLTVAVNVPARVLLDPRFPDYIAAITARYAIAPATLVVEITERSLIEHPDRASRALSQLSELGVRLSLDDFGTGYSSLAYLGRLPLDEIKIDRCFVSGLTTIASDAAIVRATVDLGRSLGLRVVAEGVEDARTYRDLALLGCNAIQGFYFARPMAAGDVAGWISGSQARGFGQPVSIDLVRQEQVHL